MAGVGDQELTVARVYSTAMLKLAEGLGEVDLLQEELGDLAGRIEADTAFAGFLTDPTVDAGARTQALEKLFRGRYSDLFVDSLQVLNQKGRLGLIRAVAKSYHLERETLLGRIEVYVRSAAPLNDELRERLRAAAATFAGMEVDLVETLDASVIGGVIVQIGDEKFDASVASKLRRVGAALTERASHEIHSGKKYFEGTAA